jgi:uncharacterized protein YjiS (DUF1127 family)
MANVTDWASHCSCRLVGFGRVADRPHPPRASLLRQSLTLVLAWHGRWRQRRALAALDDRLLCDIGATRDEARREAMRSFWQAGPAD